MQCPQGGFTHIPENGIKSSKPSQICVSSLRQFIKDND